MDAVALRALRDPFGDWASVAGPVLAQAILLVDPTRPEEAGVAKRLAAQMAGRSLRLGGTITGELGVGFGKRGLMEAEHGKAWTVMGVVKRALDPLGLMNPGKLVPDDPDRQP